MGWGWNQAASKKRAEAYQWNGDDMMFNIGSQLNKTRQSPVSRSLAAAVREQRECLVYEVGLHSKSCRRMIRPPITSTSFMSSFKTISGRDYQRQRFAAIRTASSRTDQILEYLMCAEVDSVFQHKCDLLS